MTDYTDPDLQTWERIAIFNELHGDNALRIGNWIYYADGATRDPHPEGALMEPPKNPLELNQNIMRYFEEKLRLKVKEFDTLKAQLLDDENGWVDDEKYHGQLSELQQEVRRTQNKLNDARAEYNKYDPHYVIPEEARRPAGIHAATEKRRRDFRDSITAIEI